MAASFTQQSTTATMTFQNPRSSQPLSPLMGRPMNGNATGLPAEIRIKILRCLLRSGDLIRSQDEVGEAEFNTATKLSSQILQTCQVLYEEGSVILYHENTLAVLVADGFRNDHNLHLRFLGVAVLEQSTLEYAGGVLVLPLLQDLVERKEGIGSTNVRGTYKGKKSLDSWIDAYEILARFQKFHVVFRLEFNWRCHTFIRVCRRLRIAFLNKDVVMTIGPKWTTDASEVLAYLLPCRVLRCQSLRFELPTEANVDDVVRITTSQEPLVDTYGMTRQLYRDVLDKLDHFETKPFDIEHQSLWLKMFKKAQEYDVPASQKLKEQVLEKAREWTRDCVRRRLERIEEEGAKLEELINGEMGNELKAIE